MTQTQLASMFMGKPIMLDDDLIDSIPKDTTSQIYIVDGQVGTILDHISPKFIINDGNHKRSLENTLETFDAIVLNGTHTEHLEKRNRDVIFDEDYTLREFVLFEVAEYRDREGLKVQFFSRASYLELKKASILYPDSFTRTASQHAGWSLNDTGWQVGIVESTGT